MVTREQVGVGLGAAGVGLLTAEGIQQAGERDLITERQADLAAAGVGAASLWAAILGELDVIPLSPAQTITAAGFGLGEVGWTAGRHIGVVPMLTVRVPDEVNLASPLFSALVFSGVGAGAATLAGLVR